MSNDISPALMSILIEHINAGKMDDDEICKDIAAYINMLPMSVYFWDSLHDFIREYGEDVDETYMGRDADGEKVYHIYNRDTNWQFRINKELGRLGYFKRYAEQKAA